MKRIAIPLLLLALPAFCAAAEPADNEIVQKYVPVKNMGGTDRIQRLVGLLRTNTLSVNGDPVLKMISLQGRRSAVADAEKLIAQFDTAARNTVEVIAYLLGASDDPARAGTVPKTLEPVTKELTRVFGYKSFALRESAILRATEGSSAEASGFLPVAVPANAPRIYRIGFEQSEVIPDAQRRTVRLSRLFFQTEVVTYSPEKVGSQVQMRLNSSSIDVREGQSVVVGKSNVNESGDVIVVVLTARVIN